MKNCKKNKDVILLILNKRIDKLSLIYSVTYKSSRFLFMKPISLLTSALIL
jgi:hypothetical protein